MEDFQTLKFLIEHLNDQSKFLFDKVVTLFIFFCTVNLTAILSGYLTILNSNEEKLESNKDLKTLLVDRGSTSFIIASVLGIIGTTVSCYYFFKQKTKVFNAFKSIKEKNEWMDIASINDQYTNYIIVSIIFIFAKVGFIVLWSLIRKQNKSESVSSSNK